MHNTIRTTAFLLLTACLLSSCTSSRQCAPEDAYRIEYFTGGGFTGFEQGTTLECSGRLIFWERRPGSGQQIKDSLLLHSTDRKKFDTLMNDSSLFTYAKQESGNLTTTLILSKGEKTTRVAWPTSSALPADLPASMQAIITEITSVHKK